MSGREKMIDLCESNKQPLTVYQIKIMAKNDYNPKTIYIGW